MSTISINGLQRGDLIISANNNSVLDFWINDETQRFILARPSQEIIPLAVRAPEEKTFSYAHVDTEDLRHHLAATRHRIIKNSVLPGENKDEAENINRLWGLLEPASENPPKLKEGQIFLVLFNKWGLIKESIFLNELEDTVPAKVGVTDLITDLNKDKKELSYAVLMIRNNELVIVNHHNMPHTFYGQIKSFNDLVNTQEILELTESAAKVRAIAVK